MYCELVFLEISSRDRSIVFKHDQHPGELLHSMVVGHVGDTYKKQIESKFKNHRGIRLDFDNIHVSSSSRPSIWSYEKLETLASVIRDISNRFKPEELTRRVRFECGRYKKYRAGGENSLYFVSFNPSTAPSKMRKALDGLVRPDLTETQTLSVVNHLIFSTWDFSLLEDLTDRNFLIKPCSMYVPLQFTCKLNISKNVREVAGLFLPRS